MIILTQKEIKNRIITSASFFFETTEISIQKLYKVARYFLYLHSTSHSMEIFLYIKDVLFLFMSKVQIHNAHR